MNRCYSTLKLQTSGHNLLFTYLCFHAFSSKHDEISWSVDTVIKWTTTYVSNGLLRHLAACAIDVLLNTFIFGPLNFESNHWKSIFFEICFITIFSQRQTRVEFLHQENKVRAKAEYLNRHTILTHELLIHSFIEPRQCTLTLESIFPLSSIWAAQWRVTMMRTTTTTTNR